MVLFKGKRKYALSFILILMLLFTASTAYATDTDTVIPSIEVNFGQDGDNVASSIQILVLITILSLAPSILIMMTSFTRFIIVFSFLRRAISLQSTPPNQVLIALSLFMTFFVMTPVFSDVIDNAYEPYVNQEISQEEAIDNAVAPMKEFMLRQTREEDLALFVDMSEGPQYETLEEIPITTVIPAFLISEIKTGFEIGFILFIPFIVIDMVVASTLMSLGMMMLPPVMISLPFKVLLFIMVDGWNLLVEQMLMSIK
ncbi:flagellar type III secretion system pore protein FliP [Acidaminobacter sp. JC074]|uniref:flagellar type III secretion system pore protein FliP n=1 Tax=Acidaminobacter sp. JC074 TaxID=2530199 RepID=UPI001F10C234|nr:flagellar type III secretion system pore protein FliP [Acidaminobacter sp. JC074]MCH4888735.1 flagellar type III secretion system pore protein FliP [Acidaminobacter sp. JC074]